MRAAEKILGYWLRLGVSGFRLDAVPYMVKAKGHQQFDGDPFEPLDRLNRFVRSKHREAVLLGEADVHPEGYADFFGGPDHGDRVQTLLNFYACNGLFLALATEDATPVRDSFAALPDPPEDGAYVNFSRNHDELAQPTMPDGEWGYRQLNVIEQRRDPDSLLNWTTRAVWARRECPEFGLAGNLQLLGEDQVIANVAEFRSGFAISVHNLGSEPVEVELPTMVEKEGVWLEICGDESYGRPHGGKLRLNGYGYRWFRATEFATD